MERLRNGFVPSLALGTTAIKRTVVFVALHHAHLTSMAV